MATPSEINDHKTAFAALSDAELIAQKHAWDPHSAKHIAAVQLLHEREQSAHAELLAEIKRPHWSVIPSFYLLVVSVLLTAAALAVAFFGLPQAPQSAQVASPAPPVSHTAQTKARSSSPPKVGTTKKLLP